MLQPQVGIGISAAETDPDGGVTGTTWKWFRSSRMTGPWEEISDATLATYTPQDEADNDDRNKYLRAEATYTDARIDYGEQKASAVSAHRVRAEQEDNSDPSFSQATAARNIRENTAAGMKIGGPVAAMETDSGDILVYTLAGTDAASFDIDKATGQLMTKVPLDFDTTDSYEVMVTATDSFGGQTDPVATVTISIDNIDEAPFIEYGRPSSCRHRERHRRERFR